MSPTQRALVPGLVLVVGLATAGATRAETTADPLMCINAGGGAYTSTDGRDYLADTHVSGGRTSSTDADIANTEDDALYQTERNRLFEYQIPVTNGSYRVELAFAEIYFQAGTSSGGPGSRVFDIFLEGERVEDDFDILAITDTLTALQREHPTQVEDDSLSITFAQEADFPKLSALCVYPAEGDADGDGVVDSEDAFPNDPDEWADSDGDGVGDNSDAFPNDPDEWSDLDGDGIGDNSDADRDGDGYPNDEDAFPDDPTEWLDSDGDGTGDNSDPTPNGPPEGLVMCINAGGDAHTSSDGIDFQADTHYSGGSTAIQQHDIDGTSDDALYQSERYGAFGYAIPVPAEGSYRVDLHYAEVYYQATTDSGGPGTRVFDVTGEGGLIAEDFDILAQVPSKTALVDSSTLQVSDATLNLNFSSVVENPKLSALCVYETEGDLDGDGVPDSEDAFPNDPDEWADSDGDGVGDNSDAFPNDPNEWSDLDGDGIGDNSDADRDGDGYPNDEDAFPDDPDEWADSDGDGIGDNSDPTPDGPPEGLVMCINAGGGAYTSSDGLDFQADAHYSGGSTSIQEHDIDGTTDDALYQSERYGAFGYGIPVPAEGSYRAELHYAEVYFQATSDSGGPGTRVFDVTGEGSLIADNFDILAEVPSKTALVDRSVREVTDGVFDIQFTRVADQPKLSALCIYESEDDRDGDGVVDSEDAFPDDPDEWADSDGDGVGDNADAFPNDPDEWSDLDGDGLGDNSDTDRDGDGYLNGEDAFPDDPDEWVDSDGDGIGDNRDPDPDEHTELPEICINAGGGQYQDDLGVTYLSDRYYAGGNTFTSGADIADTDNDALYQSERNRQFSYQVPVNENRFYRLDLHFAEIYFQAVSDSGGPGTRIFDVLAEGETVVSGLDILDEVASNTALVKSSIVRVQDGVLDIEVNPRADWPKLSAFCITPSEGDSDGDGVLDSQDAFPNDPNEWVDSDGDGVGDNSDAFPDDPSEWSDIDGDGVGDNSDPDRDGDGYPNDQDAFPNDPDEWLDSDGDGVGDNFDAYPNDPARSLYSDPFEVLFVEGDLDVKNLTTTASLIDNPGDLPTATASHDRIAFSDGGPYIHLFDGHADLPFEDNFAMRATRQLYIGAADYYSFLVRSDDGAKLTIGGQTVINDNLTHDPTTNRGTLYLTEGLHDLELLYFDNEKGAMVELAGARGNLDEFFAPEDQFAPVTDRINATLTPPEVFEPQIGGQWSEVVEWPEIPVSVANLPDGRLLTWSGGDTDHFEGPGTIASVYDPETDDFTAVDHPVHNQFCSGIALREDGTVFNAGGNPATAQTTAFDIDSLTWVELASMNFPRWYPTTMTLPDDRVFTTFAQGAGATSEVYSSDSGQWLLTSGASMQPLLDEQNVVNNQPVGNGSTDMQWYGFMHIAPNGRVFHSGPTETMHWFDTEGLGDIETVGKRLEGDQARMFGSAVMYDVGKILITGGNDQSQPEASSNRAITVDLNGAAPVIEETEPMANKRTFQDSVVLPDGRVLVIGGTTAAKLFSDEGTVLQPEIWDPDTGEWTPVSSHGIPRNYHSVGILMKDGRVFSGGGGACGPCNVNHQDAQFYSPDYLFNEDSSPAERPTVDSAPAQVTAGQSILVDASADVSRFTMIRLQGTTHSINTDQRFVPVPFTEVAGGYQLDINPNPNVMIPGNYWLFALDENGVPSEGRTLQVVRENSETDSDGDGFIDSQDAFPNDPTEWFDSDGDGTGDNSDAFPNDPDEWSDLDGDGVGDNSDPDRDGDGVNNTEDAFPDDPTEWSDSDGDGVGDNSDEYPDDPTRWGSGASDWEVREPANGAPQPRHENDYIAFQERFYLLGGRDSRGVNEYNALGNAWVNHGVPRNEAFEELQLHHFQSVEVGGRIYVVGALQGYFPVETGAPEIYSFDPDDPANWRTEGLVPEERRRGSTGAVNYQGKIYIVGGNTRGHESGWVPWFDVYDPATGEWTELPDAPHARDHHRAAVMDDKLYVVGGRRSSVDLGNGVGDTEAAVDVYDFDTGQWSTLANDLPTPRGGIALMKQGSELVVAAGESAEKVHEEVEALDVTDGSWRNLPSLNIGRNAPGGVVYGDELFVAAGRKPDGIETDTQEVMSLIPRSFPADSDNDGVPDDEDAFPDDSGEYSDSDGDGVGDNNDAFPNDPDEWLDSDGDGVGDEQDAFPDDPDEWADSDFDGVGDNSDAFPDDASEWADTDGDGIGDNADVYPDDPDRYAHPAAPVHNSTGLVVEDDSAGERVWVANPDNDSVSLVVGGSRVAELSVGDEPRGLALQPGANRVWVSNKADASLSVIDTAGEVVTDTIDLPFGSRPHGLVFVPGTDDLLVVLEGLAEVIRLDTATEEVIATAALTGQPRHLAVSADGTRVYVTGFITPPVAGEYTASPDVSDGGGDLRVLDATTLATLDRIRLGYSQRGISEHAGPGLPNYLNAPVLSPDGQWAYVPSKQDNILAGALRGEPGMTFDQTVRAVTSVVDLAGASENPGARLDHDNASLATGAAISGDGRYLFVALETSREVAVYDLDGGFQLTRLATGLAPNSLALSPDGERLYVHNTLGRSLDVFDLQPILASGSPRADHLASVDLVGSEALSPEVLAGKRLFHDAADDRLAQDNYLSCASCHADGGGDGRVWDLTGLGEGLRNTTSLVGRGQGHGRWHWSGNFDEVQDFESQIRALAGGSGLMSDADFDATEAPLGDAKAGLSEDLDALAAYVESLTGYPPAPDSAGTLSAEASAGEAVFQRENCAGCHSGPAGTDSDQGVLHDVGTLTAASGSGLTGLDTPSLNLLWATPPYLHDGSAASIAEAIEAHSNVSVTPDEADQLEAYLIERDDGQP